MGESISIQKDDRPILLVCHNTVIVNFILMTKFTIGLQAQLVVQTQQNMFALRISDHNPNRGWGNINIQAVIIWLYLRFCATRMLRENISSRVYPVCKTF